MSRKNVYYAGQLVGGRLSRWDHPAAVHAARTAVLCHDGPLSLQTSRLGYDSQLNHELIQIEVFPV